MSLAIRQSGPTTPAAASRSFVDIAPADVWQMAESVAAAKILPGVNTPQQAYVLMLLCQSENLHPIQAVRRYHMIQNRPVMRSDAVQGEMLARGWVITPSAMTATRAAATFAHPTKQPNGAELSVTSDQYKFLLNKDNWKNHPDDMLWARLVTKACRRFDPGIIAGIYSPDEIEDMDAYASPTVQIAQERIEAVQAITAADVPVLGCDGLVYDAPYSAVAAAAIDAANQLIGSAGAPMKAPDLHRYLMLAAIGEGHAESPPPTTVNAAIKALSKVYTTDRDWLRREIDSACRRYADETTTPAESSEDDPDPEIETEGREPGQEG